jgi:hypothetical protein
MALSPEGLGQFIMGARERVIYAAPSLSDQVATALINVSKRLGFEALSVVLDVSEEVFRLGYGLVDALTMCREASIPIRHADGLRISFVVVDNAGYIFALPPLLVEGARQTDDRPNAVRASSDQIGSLVKAVLPVGPARARADAPDICSAAKQQTGQDATLHERAEIGRNVVQPAEIEKIDHAIKANPVENFDLSRVVNVFAARIQFYEFEVRGTQIQNQSIRLPRALIGFTRDKSTRDRITAAFKLVSSDSRVSGKKIHESAAVIRKRFIHPHPSYGGVILKSDRAALEGEIDDLEQLIEKHKEAVRSRFANDAKKSIDILVKSFWRDIARTPPQDLVRHLGTAKPSTEDTKEYLRHTLAEAFPTAEEVVGAMKVTRVVKDITWNTLNEPGFIEWLKQQFPLRKDLQQPFELYRAAREKLKGKPQTG